MSQPRVPGLPAKVQQALDTTGLPYEWRLGAKHWKLFIGGRMATVISFPGGNGDRWGPSFAHNTIRDIRRAARLVKGE
jgi:hypothetical protein